MLVGRIKKATTDVRRVTVKFDTWLDTGGTITSIQSSSVSADSSGWASVPPPFPLDSDPTPLMIQSIDLVNNSTAVQLYLESGTPGNAYTVQFIIWDSANRELTVTLGVQISGTPPAAAAQPPLLANGAISRLGDTMQGRLYLADDPLQPLEASTKEYVDSARIILENADATEQAARIAGDNALLADINTAKVLVAGAGLIGGPFTLSGTAAVSGTISAEWAAGTASAIGAGLALALGTLAAQWAGGTVTATGAGLSNTAGTLAASWNGGTVTALDASLTLNAGTLAVTTPAEWTAGAVTAIGGSITLTAGTLSVPAPEWTGGTVTALGSNLSLSAGTLSAAATALQWTAGSVATVGTGLALSGGTLTCTISEEWTAGAVSSLDSSLKLAAGVLSVANSADTVIRRGSIALPSHGQTVTFSTAFPTGCDQVVLQAGDSNGGETTGIPRFWWISKSATGFVLGTDFGGGDATKSVDYVAWGK